MDRQRDSDKHGPRVDDELKQRAAGFTQGAPADPRVQEWHATEPPGDDQPDAAPGLGEAEERSELARWLRPSVFPATREELLDEAAQARAPDRISGILSGLPGDVRYANVAEAWQALGGHREQRDHGGPAERG